METIKINIHSPIYGSRILDVLDIYEENGELLIRVDENVETEVRPGDNIYFKRYVYDENGSYSEILAVSKVNSVSKTKENSLYYDVLHTDPPYVNDLEVDYRWTTYINLVENKSDLFKNGDAWLSDSDEIISGVSKGQMLVKTDGGLLYDSTFAKIYAQSGDYYKLKFNTNHNIFQQDIDQARDAGYEFDIAVKNINGGIIGYLRDISIPSIYYDRPIVMSESYTTEELEACGYYDIEGRPYNMFEHRYSHSPSWFSRDTILFGSFYTSISQYIKDGVIIKLDTPFKQLEFLMENGVRFSPRYNPFYFYSSNDNGKRCVCWGDYWWDQLSEKNNIFPLKHMYINIGNDSSVITIDDDYWKIPMIALSRDSYDLENTDIINQSYIDGLYEQLVPEVIDMERFKYVPVQGDTFLTKINLYLHFLKREGDRWYVNPNSATTTWWNNYGYNDRKFDENHFSSFFDTYGMKADMLGDLNFTDNDVYYRKSKLSKSFIRFAFYSTKNPLDQKLLYTSTIFVDTTELYGKYMKKYIEIGGNTGIPIVNYSGGSEDTVLNMKFEIENEFNTESSSEGFNLYLFADDVDANSDRTIYMKVEFNHAGVGKTIPMILWPKYGGEFVPITLDGDDGSTYSVKFLDSLYIPVKLGYIDGKYTYSISGVNIRGTEANLILFEPKIDATDIK